MIAEDVAASIISRLVASNSKENHEAVKRTVIAVTPAQEVIEASPGILHG